MSELKTLGALPDERTEEAKGMDFRFEEIVSKADTVNWVEKPESKWRKFPITYQNGSGSCVAHTEAKELGIMHFLKDGVYVPFSPTHIYQRRLNKGTQGMAATDARKIAKNGATLEVLAPSQGMTDDEMDNQKIEPYKQDVGKVFAVPNYVRLPFGDIDAVASVIQKTGKGVMVWFYFEYNEWLDTPVIKSLLNFDFANCKHSVTATDYFIWNGKKCLLIEDSWGPTYGLQGRRIITEDFFKARNWYAGYLVNFKFNEPEAPKIPKPKHTFNVNLQKDTNNPDTIALQDILKYEGFFPINTESTGFFGSITSKAVMDFQRKYKAIPESEIVRLKGNLVGPGTRAKLNELYA